MISSTSITPDVYTGAGTTDTYAFTPRILAKEDLLVYSKAIDTGTVTLLTLDSDYTIADADVDNDAGGNIVLTAGNLDTNHKLYLLRFTLPKQGVHLEEGTAFSAAVIEEEFDRLTMMVQDARELLGRALTFLVTDEISGKYVPAPGADGSILQWISTVLTTGLGAEIILTALPTSDPHVVGQLWNSSGTLKVSAG